MEGEVDARDYFLVYLRVNGCYFWFNLLQIFTSISMLALLLMEYYFMVTIIEIAITFMLALDLYFIDLCRLLRYFSEGGKTFSEGWDNRVNFFILGLLTLSIGSDLIAPELTHHDGGVVASIFLFVRYAIQLSRVCKLICESKKQL